MKANTTMNIISELCMTCVKGLNSIVSEIFKFLMYIISIIFNILKKVSFDKYQLNDFVRK